ncbi:hypothetical protein DKX38_002132 [Salix brachista]|uniref:Uncharacterized protein n=1 Tax=Salix brachista TaxID=2182728 RepID=A0A5N5NMB7_9ROSI|nr:hypothetical protein DKX38_002132 [Salix brachista]
MNPEMSKDAKSLSKPRAFISMLERYDMMECENKSKFRFSPLYFGHHVLHVLQLQGGATYDLYEKNPKKIGFPSSAIFLHVKPPQVIVISRPVTD